MKCRAYLIIDEVPIDHVDVKFDYSTETEIDIKSKAVDLFKKRPRHKMWTITPEKIEIGHQGD